MQTAGLFGAIAALLLAVDAPAQSLSTIAGRISHPDGTPAPDAPVFAAVSDRDGRLRIVAQAVSAWDGRYALANVPAGQYIVGARTRPGSDITLYPGVADAPPRRMVTVFEGVATEGIDIWLQPAPQRYAVSGRIFWPEDLGIDNLVIEYGGQAAVRSGIWFVSDPGGLFTIEGASPGTMVLLARADTAAGPLIGMASTEVSVAPVEEVRLTIEKPGSVEGRLLFARPPPAGAGNLRVALVHTLLRVSPLYPVEDAVIDQDNRFRIPSARGEYAFRVEGLPPGWRVVRVRRDGRDVTSGRVIVGPGETVGAIELVVGPSAN